MGNPYHDKLGRFASGHGYSTANVSAGQRTSKAPRKGDQPSGAWYKGKQLTNSELADLKKKAKAQGIEVVERRELGPLRKPSNRETIGYDKQGRRITARSTP